LFGLIGLFFVGLTFLFWGFAIVAALFFLVSAYFVYARFEASSGGGKLQDRIRGLVVENLLWNGEGKALDIGCGNGPLVVALAKKFPKAQVVGVDYWGGQWEYSKDMCERNAQIEGVSDRASFQKASAAQLPFPDEYYDAVVSNLVFHEVANVQDKRELIREALRVLKKGGAFSFQDLFLIKSVYGNTDELVTTLRSWGLAEVEFVTTRDAEFIPRLFKLPFMVGTIGLIKGRK
jgi:ubiquinone/menaquinone biosynthesis C-methylase UbiE